MSARKELYGHALREARSASLNCTGSHLGFLSTATPTGVRNVFVAPFDATSFDPSTAVAVTDVTAFAILSFTWSAHPEVLICAEGQDGSKAETLFAVNIVSGKHVSLADAYVPHFVSAEFPDHVLLTIKDKATNVYDLYLANVHTGDKIKVLDNDAEFSSFFVDQQFKTCVAVKASPSDDEIVQIFRMRLVFEWTSTTERVQVPGTETVKLVTSKNLKVTRTLASTASKVFEIGGPEAEPFRAIRKQLHAFCRKCMLHFNADGSVLYLKMYLPDQDTSSLVALDLTGGDLTILGNDVRSDVTGCLMHPTTHKPIAYQTYFERKKYHPLGPTDKEASAWFEILDSLAANGEWIVGAVHGPIWIVWVTQPARQTQVYTFNTSTLHANFLYDTRPTLRDVDLHPTKLVETTTTDGSSPLYAFLTIPKSKVGATKLTSEPLPMVVDLHGGPMWKGTYTACDPLHQLLAERGYAVLAVMYRATTTFGRSYQIGYKNGWAGKQVEDIVEMIKWAIDNKVANPDRIGSHGKSWGGFLSTITATLHPNLLNCIVNWTGPSDIPYFIQAMGHAPGSPEYEELMRTRSAIRNAATLQTNVLLVQGGLDRALMTESAAELARNMSEGNVAAEVAHVVFPDEGHDFDRPLNILAYGALLEVFYGKHLGGLVEPVRDDVAISSASFVVGGAYFQI
ncbi:Alpha/Beta hydrolase protein [Chytriomyces sp. MP71]|nr:Alpha/Beta hydrolase protein [Chytriomyces sp. MP71]